jgi:hypothetical protein
VRRTIAIRHANVRFNQGQPGPGIGHLLVVASHSQGNCSWQRHTILTPR